MPAAHASSPFEIPDKAPTTALVYASNGQSLWSENVSGRLTIRSRDNAIEIYRGVLPNIAGGELRVLKDGSFLHGTHSGALQWFETPQKGQPLRLWRALNAPPALNWEERFDPATIDTDFWGVMSRSAGELAIAPDQKRAAYSSR